MVVPLTSCRCGLRVTVHSVQSAQKEEQSRRGCWRRNSTFDPWRRDEHRWVPSWRGRRCYTWPFYNHCVTCFSVTRINVFMWRYKPIFLRTCYIMNCVWLLLTQSHYYYHWQWFCCHTNVVTSWLISLVGICNILSNSANNSWVPSLSDGSVRRRWCLQRKENTSPFQTLASAAPVWK